MVNNHYETMRYVMVTMRILMVSWWWLVWIFTFCFCLRPCVSFSQPIRSLDDTHLELRHNWLQNSNNFTMRPRDYLVVGGGGRFFVWLWDHEIYHTYHENSHGEQKNFPHQHEILSWSHGEQSPWDYEICHGCYENSHSLVLVISMNFYFLLLSAHHSLNQ